ncbi:MAG: RtcB family protein [Nanoarchaeota archaeon]|nr:RtcB family protein [Nanoarchaeota archaeon]MBU1031200.1 RtcB family protein [Nanoarchaeota archaeon]MBU1850338.1 RtcB family protein [Nanoarchaeota archaeon]
MNFNELKKISDAVWELPTSFKKGMRVPARIYATEKLIKSMDEGVFSQISNVACLPGIQNHAFCMPDGHWGYGFPIGGVAAFDLDSGVISPGGIGFDINCGMRLMTTNLSVDEVRPKLKELINLLFGNVPTGVGCKSSLRINLSQFKDIMTNGAKWCLENGYATKDDIKNIEDEGCIKGADPSTVSEKATSRGIRQMGTLGSGNHYLEIQTVSNEDIFDLKIAKKFGIVGNNQIAIMVHCGSRGFGHQIGTDYLMRFNKKMKDYGMSVPDRELACAPIKSREGSDYYKAMACAANTAFVNRQMILHSIRETFSKVFNKDPEDMELKLVYDVAHNIAKFEKHIVSGVKKEVLVHRKGSTRAFGPGQKELPFKYQETGQPVILGGSMETGSHLLVGTETAMKETFGSTAHGSGRTMSRSKAKHLIRGEDLQKEMEKKGIYVKSASMSSLAEEAGIAYKNISDVVEALVVSRISKSIAAFKPIGNIKG